MILDEEQCWARLAGARSGVLATVHPDRAVDAVPVVFAIDDGAIVIPIDTVKPKRSPQLQRLANIERDARCVLLVDHYEEEWSRLWWVRVHARAVSSSTVSSAALLHLGERYPQYRVGGSVVAVITLEPVEVSGWSGSGPATGLQGRPGPLRSGPA